MKIQDQPDTQMADTVKPSQAASSLLCLFVSTNKPKTHLDTGNAFHIVRYC